MTDWMAALLAFVIALVIAFGAASITALPAASCPEHQAAVAASLPDARYTPGAVLANVTTEDVCRAGYSEDARGSVSGGLRRKILGNYGGADQWARGTYELDHLVPVELAGATSAANLWPQRITAKGTWGAKQKNRIENRLKRDVCAGVLTLDQAQKEIRTNWIGAYKSRFGNPDSSGKN